MNLFDDNALVVGVESFEWIEENGEGFEEGTLVDQEGVLDELDGDISSMGRTSDAIAYLGTAVESLAIDGKGLDKTSFAITTAALTGLLAQQDVGVEELWPGIESLPSDMDDLARLNAAVEGIGSSLSAMADGIASAMGRLMDGLIKVFGTLTMRANVIAKKADQVREAAKRITKESTDQIKVKGALVRIGSECNAGTILKGSGNLVKASEFVFGEYPKHVAGYYKEMEKAVIKLDEEYSTGKKIATAAWRVILGLTYVPAANFHQMMFGQGVTSEHPDEVGLHLKAAVALLTDKNHPHEEIIGGVHIQEGSQGEEGITYFPRYKRVDGLNGTKSIEALTKNDIERVLNNVTACCAQVVTHKAAMKEMTDAMKGYDKGLHRKYRAKVGLIKEALVINHADVMAVFEHGMHVSRYWTRLVSKFASFFEGTLNHLVAIAGASTSLHLRASK